jgi:hypothetical protein
MRIWIAFSSVFAWLGVITMFTVPTVAQTPNGQITATPITVGETFHLKSQRLKEEREIEVYLPASYTDSNQRYPVMYALDGEATGPVAANAVRFLTGYAAVPLMPEAIVVAVVNTDRNRDMPVPTEYGRGGEANFLAFLSDELIPAIEKRYRTEPLRVLLGHSQGGLFAHYALTTRPSAFQWYLALDAPLSGFPEVKPMLEKSIGLISTPVFKGRLVSVETLYGWKRDWPATGWAKGSYGDQIRIDGETHETMPYKGAYEGLRSLFHDYSPPVEGKAKGVYTLPELEQMYQTLSLAYGYRVPIPRALLLLSASENIAVRHGAEAAELLKRAESLYGATHRTQQLLAEAEEAATVGRDARLEEWAKLPPPELGAMKPFLGSWESVTPDGARLRIKFTAENGVFSVQYTLTPPGGDAFAMDVQFVRPSDAQHLEWGVHNGKGTGIIHFSGKLRDENTWQGTIEPVGIEHAPPPHPATFKRVG